VSFESEVAAILDADPTLDALLTGGVHISATVGPLGITRETVPTAFDANFYLKPTALVRQRNKVPTGDVLDFDARIESARQMVEVWLYDDSGSGYATLDTAAARVRTLLMGETLTGSFELRLALWIDRQRDEGALSGAAMQRLDWQVDFILE
jgi:hypothetical protein